jgi:hypothetical protein
MGSPGRGFIYELFAGDGLNTLTVPTGKIDPHLVYSGSVWWEPLGTYGIPGTRARSMYDDYRDNKKDCGSIWNQLYEIKRKPLFQYRRGQSGEHWAI